MRNRMNSLAACALLCGGAYADDHAQSPPNQNGSRAAVKQTDGGNSAIQGHTSIRGDSQGNARASDLVTYAASFVNARATELLAIPKLREFSGRNATVGTGPVSGRAAFLLQKEHDAAVGLFTTNVALRFKLSADGVYLNLAF